MALKVKNKPFLFAAQPYSSAPSHFLPLPSISCFPCNASLHVPRPISLPPISLTFPIFSLPTFSPVSSWFLSIFVPVRGGTSIRHVAGIAEARRCLDVKVLLASNLTQSRKQRSPSTVHSLKLTKTNYLHTLLKIDDMKTFVFAKWSHCVPPYIVPLPPRPGEFAFQRHLDPLVCFCRAHGRDKQTDRPRYMRSNRPHLYAMHCDAS